MSASTLVDMVFRAYGTLVSAYRISESEAQEKLGQILWGINLKMLKCKKDFDIYELLAKIKENHLTTKKENIKEVEKKRAKLLFMQINKNVERGEVDV